MKVLIVDSSCAFGGAFELALTLVEFLSKIPEVKPVLVSAQSPEVLKSRTPASVPFYHLNRGSVKKVNRIESSRGKIGALFKIIFKELPIAFKIKRIARKEKADIIHLNNMLNSQVHGVLAAWLSGLACVCCHREYEYDSAYIRYIERHVDAHVVGSKLIAEDVLKLGVKPEKVVTIWDGADPEKFSPELKAANLQELFGIPRERVVFGIFGRLIDWKGQDVFLKAAARVMQDFPRAHALIVGGPSDGSQEYVQQLETLARELKIENRVTFTGFRSDVPALMRACSILVHASLRPEPFGTALLEGMACGIPYVAINQGGPADMIEPEVSGLLVPAGDVEAMAVALKSLLGDPAKMRRMGFAARARFLSHLSAENFAQRHFELYQRCLKNGKN